MYQPIGIGFSRDILVRDFGARNVIYCDEEEMRVIPDSLQWRCQKLVVDVYDFEYLREWRIKGNEFDFSSFPKEHILIIAPDRNCLNDFVIRNDMIFNPIEDYYSGNFIENWDEGYLRNYKGLTLKEATSKGNDYDVSAFTEKQILDEDMLKEFSTPGLYVLEHNAKK